MVASHWRLTSISPGRSAGSPHCVRSRSRCGEPIGEVLTATVAALRGMPQHGLAYGAVRWLRPADDPVARALRQQPAAEVSVNYLGRLDSGVVAGSGLVRPGGPAPGPARHPDAARPYALDVVAGLRDGELVIWLSHAGEQPGIELAEAIALRCLNLLRELARAEPPDAPAEPVASHRLTPMQEAMLYSPEATRGSGVYVEQSVLELPAGTDHHQLRRRWERAVRRHGILRTRFVEDADGGRVQQVLPRVGLPWRVVDWRHLAPDEAQLRLDGLLAEDRRRGFAIDQPPLMRLTRDPAVGRRPAGLDPSSCAARRLERDGAPRGDRRPVSRAGAGSALRRLPGLAGRLATRRRIARTGPPSSPTGRTPRPCRRTMSEPASRGPGRSP